MLCRTSPWSVYIVQNISFVCPVYICCVECLPGLYILCRMSPLSVLYIYVVQNVSLVCPVFKKINVLQFYVQSCQQFVTFFSQPIDLGNILYTHRQTHRNSNPHSCTNAHTKIHRQALPSYRQTLTQINSHRCTVTHKEDEMYKVKAKAHKHK